MKVSIRYTLKQKKIAFLVTLSQLVCEWKDCQCIRSYNQLSKVNIPVYTVQLQGMNVPHNPIASTEIKFNPITMCRMAAGQVIVHNYLPSGKSLKQNRNLV